MKKIPTVFVRNPDDRRYVLDQITSGCEWVLEGEGVATRKYDGTCVMRNDDGDWWARREVKPGKNAPPLFVAIEHDEETGKTVGWEPIEQSPFAKFHAEADTRIFSGTYELVGPKINGNPEGYPRHTLIAHDDATILLDVPRDYNGLKDYLSHPHIAIEGIVWHHPDGRMAKLKRRDFPA